MTGLLESPIPARGRPFEAKVTQGPEVMSVETTAAFTETAPAKPARQKSELRMPFFPSF